ncbi:MAG: hypothetical protein ABEI06_01590 [Halobacteriaceae archaeon]
MRVRDWQDIIQDVADESVDAQGWRAISGDRKQGVGEDLYLGHPNAGVYLLKTFAKNPYKVRGVGTQVARKIDDEIGNFLPQESEGRFAIQEPPESEEEAKSKAKELEEVIKAHAEAPTDPDDLLDDMMETLESPAFGPMKYSQYDRPEELDELSSTFDEAENILNAEFEDLIEEDRINKGFQ